MQLQHAEEETHPTAADVPPLRPREGGSSSEHGRHGADNSGLTPSGTGDPERLLYPRTRPAGAPVRSPAHTSLVSVSLGMKRRTQLRAVCAPVGCSTTSSRTTAPRDGLRRGGPDPPKWTDPREGKRLRFRCDTARRETTGFYITRRRRRTSSSDFCAGACDGYMVSLLKGYPRVTVGRGGEGGSGPTPATFRDRTRWGHLCGPQGSTGNQKGSTFIV